LLATVAVLIPITTNAGNVLFKHSIKNKTAVVKAVKKDNKTSFSLGLEALYTDEYISALQTGRKWPLYSADARNPVAYDITSRFTISPSRYFLVTHSSDFLNTGLFRDVTKIAYDSHFFGQDVASTIWLRYDSGTDDPSVATRTVLLGDLADIGYTAEDGRPATIFAGNSFESSLGQINMEYRPAVEFDILDQDHVFSNSLNVSTQFNSFDFAVAVKEFFKQQSGSFYSRRVNISYGEANFGIASRDMDNDTWKNGYTLYWQNWFPHDQSSDFAIKTSYKLPDNSHEKRLYIELIWGLKNRIFNFP